MVDMGVVQLPLTVFSSGLWWTLPCLQVSLRTMGLDSPIAEGAARKRPSAVSSQSHLVQKDTSNSYLVPVDKLLYKQVLKTGSAVSVG